MTADETLQRDRELAQLLAHTWGPFFQRFGRLTEVQRRVIPAILRGDDVLVSAPTASGKTEAVCAPLVERFAGRRGRWTILYVSPTRALVNDLFERLEAPLRMCSLRLGRRTGEHCEGIDQGAHVLITTPESFDSLLCRGRQAGAGHVLAPVVAVVLDEIHVIDGGARGEQLRWLLARLRRLRNYAAANGFSEDSFLQVVALSATVADPEGIAQRFLRPEGLSVTVAGARSIEMVIPPSPPVYVEEALPRFLRESDESHKVLVFCNSRRRVDELTSLLNKSLEPLEYEAHAHHGSLSKTHREEVESKARSLSRIVVVATSTLEMGIDIGDIDLVALDGSPPDVSSFLQRIGRGNRRSGQTRVLPCARSSLDARVMSAMVDAARTGDLGPVRETANYAVASQQIASYIFQAGVRSRGRPAIEALLAAVAAPVVRAGLLDAMIQGGDVLDDGDRIRLGGNWLDRAETGTIHSNIESTPGTTVIDEFTGAAIAHGVEHRGGSHLGVGGRERLVRGYDDRQLVVRTVAQRGQPGGEWAYAASRGGGAWGAHPTVMRSSLGLAPNEWPAIWRGDGWRVFHLGGDRMRALIELLRITAGRPRVVGRVDDWSLEWRGDACEAPGWLSGVDELTLRSTVEPHIQTFENALRRPFANRKLPIAIRVDEVLKHLAIENALQLLRRVRWEPDPSKDVAESLAIIHDERYVQLSSQRE